MKPSEIRNVLEDHEVRPSKSLGQNFLTDENVARWIVEQLEIRPQDCVVEVGPGTGSLTEHAAPLCRKLVLVEFDSRLAEYQKERWAGDPHVEVHHADGASWDPRGLFAEAPVKFLGNLPYSAGGAILQNFLSRPSAVERAVVMLQKESIAFWRRRMMMPSGCCPCASRKTGFPVPLKPFRRKRFIPVRVLIPP